MPARVTDQPQPAATCGIAASAHLACPFAEVAQLRDRPGPAGAPALPARFLRHCDEQTVVGMHAMLAALADHPGPRPGFGADAVVAAPRQAGRAVTARTLSQVAREGAVAVTPHVVPQCSLHSLAGAVSVGLGLHGPHLGVGGGPDALAEGLFAALSLLSPAAGTGLPGVWLVATGWRDEPPLDAAGRPAWSPTLEAVAVRLVPVGVAARAGLALTWPAGRSAAVAGDDDVAAFAAAVTARVAGDQQATWTVACPWGAEIRVTSAAAAGRDIFAPHHPFAREAA